MPCRTCPECACSTDDRSTRLCACCRTEMLNRCPQCAKPVAEEKAVYIRACGFKWRQSIVPVQSLPESKREVP